MTVVVIWQLLLLMNLYLLESTHKIFLNKYLEESGQEVIFEAFVDNIVSYEPDVKSVLAKGLMGEADIAVVYESDAAMIDESDKVVKISIPDAYNQKGGAYASLLLSSDDLKTAFYEFMTEGDGQMLLRTFGFRTSK